MLSLDGNGTGDRGTGGGEFEPQLADRDDALPELFEHDALVRRVDPIVRQADTSSAVAAPVIRRYATPLHEAAHVSAEVASLHLHGWPAGGGAILVHDNTQLDVVAALLTAAGVPFYRRRQVNVLVEEPLAVAARALLVLQPTNYSSFWSTLASIPC